MLGHVNSKKSQVLYHWKVCSSEKFVFFFHCGVKVSNLTGPLTKSVSRIFEETSFFQLENMEDSCFSSNVSACIFSEEKENLKEFFLADETVTQQFCAVVFLTSQGNASAVPRSSHTSTKMANFASSCFFYLFRATECEFHPRNLSFFFGPKPFKIPKRKILSKLYANSFLSRERKLIDHFSEYFWVQVMFSKNKICGVASPFFVCLFVRRTSSSINNAFRLLVSDPKGLHVIEFNQKGRCLDRHVLFVAASGNKKGNILWSENKKNAMGKLGHHNLSSSTFAEQNFLGCDFSSSTNENCEGRRMDLFLLSSRLDAFLLRRLEQHFELLFNS